MKFLIEKFNETMPAWLRKRLLFTDNRMPKDATYQSSDEHPRARQGSAQSEGLFKEFIKKNIDLSNAKFTSVDPKSLQRRNDPRLKEPYLPIFHIVANDGRVNTVYAIGINDNDKWPGRSWDDPLADKAFRSIPLKTLIEVSQDFCYLDLSDPTNLLDPEKQSARKNNALGMYDQRYTPGKDTTRLWGGPYYNLRSKDTGRIIQQDPTDRNSKNRFWSGDPYSVPDASDYNLRVDKSGYIRNPHKYDQKLKELKARNYSRVLNDLYSRIKTVQAGMGEAFADYNFKHTAGNIKASLFSDFQSMISNYNELMSEVDDIVKNYSDDPDRFASKIQRVFDVNSYSGEDYKDTLEYLRKIEKEVSDYITVPIDWEVGEDDFQESFRKNRLSLSEFLFEDLENLDKVDLSLNPVMQQAKRWSEDNQDRIDGEMDELERYFPSGEKVIGAEKQEVPNEVKYPKTDLEEAYIDKLGNYKGTYAPLEIHGVSLYGKDMILDDTTDTPEEAVDKITDYIWEILDNRSISASEKIELLDGIYIVTADTHEKVESEELDRQIKNAKRRASRNNS